MQQPPSQPHQADRNPPVHTIRYGTIRAAIWKREVDLGNNSRPMYGVTFTRSYKDGNEWKESASFGPDDLLTVAKIADEAHTFVHQARSQENAARRESKE